MYFQLKWTACPDLNFPVNARPLNNPSKLRYKESRSLELLHWISTVRVSVMMDRQQRGSTPPPERINTSVNIPFFTSTMSKIEILLDAVSVSASLAASRLVKVPENKEFTRLLKGERHWISCVSGT